jgi:hypothetical protein
MSFGAHILSTLEHALSECLPYHNSLRDFLVRAGVPGDALVGAINRAEERARNSPRGWKRAPKRFIIQELLNGLTAGGADGDRHVAALITAVMKGQFPDATPAALKAIDALRAYQQNDKQEREEIERRRREERQEREREEQRQREAAVLARLKARDAFREQFLSLEHQSDDAQGRGYALEKFLNEFFAFENLAPRGSFKLVGEQIDGSFAWANRTHLTEAKWVKAPVAGSAFSSLMYKIQGKSADTRGLFIAINGYSTEALQGLHLKGELRFVCIDGAHLMRCFEPGGSLPRLLEIVWRHAGETGNAYLPASKIQSW